MVLPEGFCATCPLAETARRRKAKKTNRCDLIKVPLVILTAHMAGQATASEAAMHGVYWRVRFGQAPGGKNAPAVRELFPRQRRKFNACYFLQVPLAQLVRPV